MSDVYARVEELLKRKGLTAYKLSQLTGISTSVLSQWKYGNFNLKPPKLQLIADCLGVSIEYLLNGKEYDPQPNKNAVLIAQIADNPKYCDIMLKFVELSDDKKKLIMDTVDMLSVKKS